MDIKELLARKRMQEPAKPLFEQCQAPMDKPTMAPIQEQSMQPMQESTDDPWQVYRSMLCLQQAKITCIEDVAAELVQHFGYQDAHERAMAQAEIANTDKEQRDWEFLADTIESLTPISAPVPAPAQAKPRSLKELLALKAQKQQANALAAEPVDSILPTEPQPTEPQYSEHTYVQAQATHAEQMEGTVDATHASKQESFALNITLNADQIRAKDMALAGQSFCLIGAAGTGKTTTQRSVAEQLLQDERLGTTTFKLQGQAGQRVSAPSIAFVAYTRRATANLQRAIHKLPELEEALQYNIMTIHSLLEYQPVFFFDDVKQKESMRFEPMRHAGNPLEITHLVIEEASMAGLDLWEKLYDALPNGVQIIFIGDINQLPPVFGPSILNYALVQLPVVELRTVYRQAEDSSIIANAHKILKGQMIEAEEDFQIIEGKNKTAVGQAKMSLALARMFEKWLEEGFYDPEQDMILSPFNKQDLGTDNMNKWIAQYLGAKRNAVVWEVIAGFTKLYLAVGDKVMFNKQDGIIERITHNGQYMGKLPQKESTALSRFGMYKIGHEEGHNLDDVALGYENFSIEDLESQDMERKQACSHMIDIRLLDDNRLVTISSAGELAPAIFSLGYVLTVHKAQGCEWRKVFFIQHKDHNIMNFRELIYTAVTRARQELIWIAKRMYIEQGISRPRIKGNTVQDKIEFFNANMDLGNGILCTK